MTWWKGPYGKKVHVIDERTNDWLLCGTHLSRDWRQVTALYSSSQLCKRCLAVSERRLSETA